MKYKYFISICYLFSVLSLSAQDIQGVATYKSHRKMDIKMDSTQMNEEMRNQITAMLKKQSEKEFTLDFDSDESLYKEVPGLAAPNVVNSGGMQIMVNTNTGSDILYRNISENRYVNQNEIFGKQFLIADSLNPPEWKLEKDTKNIGEYTCFKATYVRTVSRRNVVHTSEESDESEKSEPIEEEITVTAWYTPQIPLRHGPGQYWGLPGHILEINAGNETILCSKIVLNPKEKEVIKAPTAGKQVSQETYDTILEEKRKEMEERYQEGRKKGHGNTFEIKIGG